jgi:hypothetical protein
MTSGIKQKAIWVNQAGFLVAVMCDSCVATKKPGLSLTSTLSSCKLEPIKKGMYTKYIRLPGKSQFLRQ